MGSKKRNYTVVNNGYFNIFDYQGKETPEVFKEADEYLKLYYGRGNSLSLELSSISLLENGFWLNTLGSDLVDGDGVCVIPDGINYIRTNCCINNKFIKKIVFPSSLIEIGEYAFDGLSNLSNLEFSYGVERISGYAFNASSVNYLNFPGSIKTCKRQLFGIYSHLSHIKLNYGTEICLVPYPSYLKEIWISPTVREIRCDSSIMLGGENYKNLKQIYIFKGDTRWKNVFKYPDSLNAKVIEVEDGWGDWRENALNDLDRRIYSYLNKIKKLESRSTIIDLDSRIAELNNKIQKLEEEKKWINNLKYE